jgi:hypothetical protein
MQNLAAESGGAPAPLHNDGLVRLGDGPLIETLYQLAAECDDAEAAANYLSLARGTMSRRAAECLPAGTARRLARPHLRVVGEEAHDGR